jgi:enoyl-CoA hydratase/carnithine racemase
VRVVVIRGAGKAFSSGRDLREMGQQQAAGGPPEVNIVEVFHAIETLSHPTMHFNAVLRGARI